MVKHSSYITLPFIFLAKKNTLMKEIILVYFKIFKKEKIFILENLEQKKPWYSYNLKP